MKIQEILAKSSRKAARRHAFFNLIAPAMLFLLTLATTLSAGSLLSGEEYLSTSGLLQGLPFAFATIFIVGAHAFGHYLTARTHGVGAYLPYFVPKLGIAGTAGAYTKMKWPISDRNSLIRIFTIGPIAGFCASWLLFTIGLNMSRIIDEQTSQYSVTLGDSLITYLTERLIFGQVPENKDVLLHPLAYAGWMGLYYNCWHLLPIGKLDGGRILYALFGLKKTKWISWCSIIILVILGFIWSGWIAMAIFGALCMINVRDQYPTENYTDEIQKTQPLLIVIALLILIVSFAPIPIHIMGI